MTKNQFIQEYSKKINEDQASLFIGAGISIASGYPNWKELMQPIANDLGLKIEKEDNLPMLAEYYVNERGSRNHLLNLIREKLVSPGKLNDNHRLIADMPVKSIWTTNFDSLLEDYFIKVKKDHFIIRVNTSIPYISEVLTIYKMHGDFAIINDIILTQSDYDNYEINYPDMADKFFNELSGKTFLFIGFSMKDPNFMQIMRKIRRRFKNNKREHYAIIIEPKDRYEKCEFVYFAEGLKSFGIHVIKIKEPYELTELLEEIVNKCPKTPKIISSQIGRNNFIINCLEELLNSTDEKIEIYNSAVFSSFAISDSPDYKKNEPIQENDHFEQIVKEKDLFYQLLVSNKIHLKLLLCPPVPVESENLVRYQNILNWMIENKSRKNLEVRCTSLKYFTNILLVKDHFCIVSNYLKEKGYHENRVYEDKKSIEDFIQVFNARFEETQLNNINSVIKHYQSILMNFLNQNNREKWRTFGKTIIKQWHNYTLVEDKIRIHGKKNTDYTYIKHPGSVIIIPILNNGDLLLIEQFRYVIKKKTLEFPCGGIEDEEQPLEAASRELLEETNFTAKLTMLGSFYASNGYSDERIYVVLANNLNKGKKNVVPDEQFPIKLKRLHYSELFNMINSGLIDDGPTISSAFLLQTYLQTGI